MSRPVRQERTGWRDQRISERHRCWGWDCPMLDLDFVVLEFNKGKPSALVEYKAFGAHVPDLTSLPYKALRALADASAIPLLVVFYVVDEFGWRFRVTPANNAALTHLKETTAMTEREYVTFLYHLRGLELPAELSNRLSHHKPDLETKPTALPDSNPFSQYLKGRE